MSAGLTRLALHPQTSPHRLKQTSSSAVNQTPLWSGVRMSQLRRSLPTHLPVTCHPRTQRGRGRCHGDNLSGANRLP